MKQGRVQQYLLPKAALAALAMLPVQAAHAQGWPAPVSPLPEMATAIDKRFQPALDFDKDVCFNVPAVNASGAISGKASTYSTKPPASCRNADYLRTSNAYSRTRCNHGYCAHVYDYFWQSDFSHAYDWETIIVWTTDAGSNSAILGVTRGKHGDWEMRKMADGQLRFQNDGNGQHVKMVFHYENGGFSHLFRFSKTDSGDEPPENGTGTWVIQPLVSWNGFPSYSVRDAVSNYDFGKANFKLKDANFPSRLSAAMDKKLTPGFDPNSDSGSDSPGCPSGARIC
ncbi:NPP1 family protein [Sphingomonas sp. TDK1]|uniref:NPP1 family protein n=1 Tax=Sphingomonas sp. TDK1 TaxID=453247 RepID=UPI0007D90BBA|nr:NPP1 family protein [Sphingomonas sp. TDK1]OAN58480.1 hypothetical protein A7X12_05380 [Sphingomonas sp. TDK1]